MPVAKAGCHLSATSHPAFKEWIKCNLTASQRPGTLHAVRGKSHHGKFPLNGGGVRRRETIDPEKTYAPFLCKDLLQRGTLYPDMELSSLEGVETSHGQGTLYIMTGKYDKFKDVGGKFLGQRFESKVPTIFEYLRKEFAVPEHQTLIVNGEDRTDEEFYSFSNHHLFGASYRSETLSLFRFKTYLLRQQIETAAQKAG